MIDPPPTISLDDIRIVEPDRDNLAVFNAKATWDQAVALVEEDDDPDDVAQVLLTLDEGEMHEVWLAAPIASRGAAPIDAIESESILCAALMQLDSSRDWQPTYIPATVSALLETVRAIHEESLAMATAILALQGFIHTELPGAELPEPLRMALLLAQPVVDGLLPLVEDQEAATTATQH
jgi:hypothetical protein